jgi:hypothetical protein
MLKFEDLVIGEYYSDLVNKCKSKLLSKTVNRNGEVFLILEKENIKFKSTYIYYPDSHCKASEGLTYEFYLEKYQPPAPKLETRVTECFVVYSRRYKPTSGFSDLITGLNVNCCYRAEGESPSLLDNKLEVKKIRVTVEFLDDE